MAVAALRNLVCEQLRELTAMDVFVALLALFRRFLEVHVDELGFHVGRLVAIDAGDRAMRAGQRKRGSAVVKTVQFFPGLGRVAGLAAHRLSVLPGLGHPLLELPVMHVFMAGRTRQVFKVVRNLRFRLILIGKFVAIAARHCQMPARKIEFCLLMLGKREGRRAVSLQVVTLVALVLVGLAGELVIVFVHMAIGAALEVCDLEDRVLALGRVALVALHFGVPVDEGIVRFGVGLHVKQRWFPALDVMTVGALDASGPLRKLAVVLVFMTIAAFREGKLFLEVSF